MRQTSNKTFAEYLDEIPAISTRVWVGVANIGLANSTPNAAINIHTNVAMDVHKRNLEPVRRNKVR